MLQLQRLAGNGAVSGLIAAARDTTAEAEADSLALRAARSLTEPSLSASAATIAAGADRLPRPLQTALGPHVGDTSTVRINSGPEAQAGAAAIRARAFTHQGRVQLGAGERASPDAAELVMHEAVHAVRHDPDRHEGRDGDSRGRVLVHAKLMDSKTFQSRTRLRLRKGKSGQQFQQFTALLRQYEVLNARGAPVAQRLQLLEHLDASLEAWMKQRGVQKSSRYAQVVTLEVQVSSEIHKLRNRGGIERQAGVGDVRAMGGLQQPQPQAPAPQPEPEYELPEQEEVEAEDAPQFSKEHVTRVEPEKYGGQLSKLDEIEYGFGVDKSGRKVQGGTFTGLFKEQAASFGPEFKNSRAPYSGLEEPGANESEEAKKAKVNIAGRNLATYAVDKLLAADVITPTWRATALRKTGDVEGIVMKKVEGKLGDEMTKEMKKDPAFRRGISNLYLIDIICAQVDRHAKNYMIEMREGTIVGVKGIDNDLAFGRDYVHHNLGWEKFYRDSDPGKVEEKPKGFAFKGQSSSMGIAGKFALELNEIDRTMAERIVALSKKPDLLRQAIGAYLEPAEVEAAVLRLQSLAGFLRPLMNKPDGPIITEWK